MVADKARHAGQVSSVLRGAFTIPFVGLIRSWRCRRRTPTYSDRPRKFLPFERIPATDSRVPEDTAAPTPIAIPLKYLVSLKSPGAVRSRHAGGPDSVL